MRKARLDLVAVVVSGLLALGGPARAQDVPELDNAQPKVSGVVRDQAGSPVAGAQVAALPMSNRYVLTDAEGKFDIGWQREWEPGEGLCLMARQVNRNLAALVGITGETKMIEIKLEPALTLAGTVTGPDDKPVAGAKVGVSLVKGWGCGTPVKGVVTDHMGRYKFKALPQKQQYSISARANGFGRGEVTTGTINGKTDVAEVEQIILKPMNMSISGVVIDVDGKPVAGAEVSIQDQGQPERKTQTDAEGKFTLERICSGSVTVYAHEDSGLDGGTYDVQAGEKDVEVIVFKECEKTPFEVSSVPTDPQKQGLRYHWARNAWRLVDGKAEQVIKLGSQRPESVRLPNFKHKGVLLGRWLSPMVRNGYIWIAMDRTHEYGLYDRLFIDSNGNGHLDDESVVNACEIGNQKAHFGPVKVLLEGESGPITYHLSFSCFHSYTGIKELRATSAGWYEGDIMVGEFKKHCLLVDKNADGTFDTKSLDSLESDLIAFGQKDDRIVRTVGNYVELDGTLYRQEISRDGQYMNVKLTVAEDVKYGTVRLPEDIAEFVAAGENGRFIVKPANGAVKLPAGKYCIDRWTMEQKDEKDNKWTLKGHSFGDSGIFEVSERRETVLTVGEPIITGVDQISKKDALYSFVNPNVKGRFGECLDLDRNEHRVEAQLHIRSKDGSYDRTFTFEYG